MTRRLWLIGAIAMVVAIVSYVLWVIAVSDDYGGAKLWTVLTAAVFLAAVAVLAGTIVVGLVRSRRGR